MVEGVTLLAVEVGGQVGIPLETALNVIKPGTAVGDDDSRLCDELLQVVEGEEWARVAILRRRSCPMLNDAVNTRTGAVSEPGVDPPDQALERVGVGSHGDEHERVRPATVRRVGVHQRRRPIR